MYAASSLGLSTKVHGVTSNSTAILSILKSTPLTVHTSVLTKLYLVAYIGVTWGCKGANTPPIFYLLKNNFFFGTELDKGE
jgi:hypothetical protein